MCRLAFNRQQNSFVCSMPLSFSCLALAALLTQALRVLPSGWMAGILYLHGAVLTLIAFGMLAYLDSYCQTKNEVLVEAEEG